MEIKKFEVIIVGGSYSGLSTAMSLGRSLRKTLVIDSGKPCNRYTPHSQNFLTHDGRSPAEIASLAIAQLKNYNTVSFLDDTVISVYKHETGFLVKTQNDKTFEANIITFASGVKDILHPIEGFLECWGKSIIHCPYCHGYEYRDEQTAIWIPMEHLSHFVPLIFNLTKKLTILTNGDQTLKAEELQKFKDKGINVIDSKISKFSHNEGNLSHIAFEDGSKVQFRAMYAGLPFEQHCTIPIDLGCELSESGHIKVDMFFKTIVDGIYACGDNVSPFRSVANAVANGNIAGAVINRELAMSGF